MLFKVVSIEKHPPRSSLNFTRTIVFATVEDRDQSLRIINAGRGALGPMPAAAYSGLNLSLTQKDFKILRKSAESRGTGLIRNFSTAVSFVMNHSVITKSTDPKAQEIINKFNDLLHEANKILVLGGAAPSYDRFVLYDALEYNYQLFLALYPGSDSNILRASQTQQISDKLTILDDFYIKHSDRLPGHESSKLGKVFSIIGVIVSLLAAFIIPFAAPSLETAAEMVGGLLITIGMFSWTRSHGMGLRKQQKELIDEMNHMTASYGTLKMDM